MNLEKLSKEEVEKITAMPLPPQFQGLVNKVRGAFLGDVNTVLDNAIQPLTFTIKMLLVQTEKLYQENQRLIKEKQPNRATRRAAGRAAKKTTNSTTPKKA